MPSHFTPSTDDEIAEEEILDTLKGASRNMTYVEYLQMKTARAEAPLFYVTAANFFHEQKLQKEALRILSNLAEIKAEDHQALRTLGYVLEEWNDYADAIDVYKKVLTIKEEEPQSYRDLALAYAMSGNRAEAVRLLYQVLQKDWRVYEGRYRGLREIMLNELSVLLNTKSPTAFGVNPHIVQVLPVDLRIVVDWNKDETDIDLHVIEPSGEECYYSHQQTKGGGRISADFTQGYGPEEYEVKAAMKGTYKIKIDYFGDRYQKQQVPSFVKLTVFKNFGKANQTVTIKTIKLGGGERMIDLATVRF